MLDWLLKRSKKNLEYLPLEVGYSISHSMPRKDQEYIIQSCIDAGDRVNDFEYGHKEPYWKMLIPRVIDIESCPEDLKSWMRDEENIEKLDFPYYYLKMNPSLKWIWREDPISQGLKKVLQPYFYLFHNVTYILVLMLMPGHEIPIHRDLIPGNRYKGLTDPHNSHPGEYEGVFLGEKWFADLFSNYYVAGHHKNRYSGFRTTFTARAGEFGRSYMMLDEQKVYYAPQNNNMIIDDRIFHGAEPVDFERGVVFIDGLINWDVVDRLAKVPLIKVTF